MEKYLKRSIQRELKEKIVLLTGLGQSGKTTLSTMFGNNLEYLNYDLSKDRMIINHGNA